MPGLTAGHVGPPADHIGVLQALLWLTADLTGADRELRRAPGSRCCAALSQRVTATAAVPLRPGWDGRRIGRSSRRLIGGAMARTATLAAMTGDTRELLEAALMTLPAATVTSAEQSGDADDPSASDRVFVHPVYGLMGWPAVVSPGPRTTETTRSLLRQAYEAVRARYHRRQNS